MPKSIKDPKKTVKGYNRIQGSQTLITCDACGSENKSGSKFCMTCGVTLVNADKKQISIILKENKEHNEIIIFWLFFFSILAVFAIAVWKNI